MSRLKIGVTACFNHADPERSLFKDKTLLYYEESKSHWLMEAGAFPILLPSSGYLSANEIIEEVDGMILHGGHDVAPESYGESADDGKWPGDRKRDLYEMRLIKACLQQNKPILGICRGLQILNVYFGGTLYQDLDNSIYHRNWDVYEQNCHEIDLKPNGILHKLYPETTKTTVNSVHHQGIKKLASCFKVEAQSTEDGVIEAVSLKKDSPESAWVFAVQWHPEWKKYIKNREERGILADKPILDAFLNEVSHRKVK